MYTKVFDATAGSPHSLEFERSFSQGRYAEAPHLHAMAHSVDECNDGAEQERCEWVQILIQSLEKTRSSRRHQLITGELNITNECQMSRRVTIQGATRIGNIVKHNVSDRSHLDGAVGFTQFTIDQYSGGIDVQNSQTGNQCRTSWHDTNLDICLDVSYVGKGSGTSQRLDKPMGHEGKDAIRTM